VARLSVKVTPKASRSAILGWSGEFLRVAVAAPPERGRANAELEGLIAGVLGLARERVSVVVGHAGRRKLLEIEGLSEGEIAGRLPPRVAPNPPRPR
jgi:uncharacterized protein (TIGR00251 family)